MAGFFVDTFTWLWTVNYCEPQINFRNYCFAFGFYTILSLCFHFRLKNMQPYWIIHHKIASSNTDLLRFLSAVFLLIIYLLIFTTPMKSLPINLIWRWKNQVCTIPNEMRRKLTIQPNHRDIIIIFLRFALICFFWIFVFLF